MLNENQININNKQLYMETNFSLKKPCNHKWSFTLKNCRRYCIVCGAVGPIEKVNYII